MFKPPLRIPPRLGAGQAEASDLDEGTFAVQEANEILKAAVELIRFPRALFQQEEQLVGLAVVFALKASDHIHSEYLLTAGATLPPCASRESAF